MTPEEELAAIEAEIGATDRRSMERLRACLASPDKSAPYPGRHPDDVPLDRTLALRRRRLELQRQIVAREERYVAAAIALQRRLDEVEL